MATGTILPPMLQPNLEWLTSHGNFWLVGGALRDHFLLRETSDFDFVTEKNALSAARSFANHFNGAFFALDEARDTGRVILDSHGTRQTFDFSPLRGSSIEVDLAERDFTINAMAVSLAEPDSLLDPLKGLQDLNDKVLRQCSKRSIESDPLRGLRGVRFAANIKLQINPETVEAIKRSADHLNEVASERIRDELFGMLDGERSVLSLRLLLQLDLANELFFAPDVVDVALSPMNGIQASPLEAFIGMLDVLYLRKEIRESATLIMAEVIIKLRQFGADLEGYFSYEVSGGRTSFQLTQFALVYLSALRKDLNEASSLHCLEVIDQYAERIKLSNHERDFLAPICQSTFFLEQTIGGESVSRLDLYRFYQTAGRSGVAAVFAWLALFLGKQTSPPIHDEWAERLDHAARFIGAYVNKPDVYVHPRPLLNGEDLIQEFGLEEGPDLGKTIAKMLEAQAEGLITDCESARTWVRGSQKQG